MSTPHSLDMQELLDWLKAKGSSQEFVVKVQERKFDGETMWQYLKRMQQVPFWARLTISNARWNDLQDSAILDNGEAPSLSEPSDLRISIGVSERCYRWWWCGSENRLVQDSSAVSVCDGSLDAAWIARLSFQAVYRLSCDARLQGKPLICGPHYCTSLPTCVQGSQ